LFPYPTSGNTGNTPLSFELWFSTPGGGVILGQQDVQAFFGASGYVPAIYVGTDGKLYVSMFWGGVSPVASPGTVNDGTFHHVAVTYDGATEAVYLDGALMSSRAFTQIGYASNYFYQLGTGFTEGWPAGNDDWFTFNGVIDEASLYNRALTASEVAGIFNAGSAGKCAPCVLPRIIQQPINQIGFVGQNSSFAVTAANVTSYQWQFNGQNLADGTHIVGATNSGLTIIGVTAADVGGYRVVLSNACGMVTSTVAQLTLRGGCVAPPQGLFAWYRAEGDATDSAGSNNGFLVNVNFAPGEVGQGFSFNGNAYVGLPVNLFPYPTTGSGNAPFSFETWFSTTSDGVILGQQNTTPTGRPSAYVPALYVGTDGRLYAAFFWDNFSRIISTATVNDGAFHHVAVTYDGTTETLFLDGVPAGSVTPFTQLAYAGTYFYQLGTGFTAGLWPAANGGWFNFNGIIDEASIYNRALDGSEVDAIFLAGSSGKCLPTGTRPSITSQPTSQTVAAGANATFSVTATGDIPLVYQWQLNGVNLAGSTHFVGVNSNLLTIVNVATNDAGPYRVLVSNAAGSITSAVATLTVTQQNQGCTPPPSGLIAWYRAEGDATDSADSHPGTLVGNVGFAAGKVGLGFSVANDSYVALPNNLFPYPTSGTGNSPFSFETWFATTASGVILGQQDTTPFNTPSGYVPALYVGTDGKLYVALFWSGFAQITTATVNDGLFHHVAVTYDGTTQNLYLDGTLIGSKPFTQRAYAANYFYQLGTGYAAGWPGATGGWFSFDGIIDEASVYNRALTAAEVAAIFNAGSNGKCPPAGVPPQITSQPASQTVAVGANASFTVTATGSLPLTYQWQLNGVNLAAGTHYVGANSNMLAIINVQPADAGSYRVLVSNASGSTTSAVATLTVTQQACTPAPSGLFAWYQAQGNAGDSAGANHGTLVGPVGFVAGKVGLGFSVAGGSYVALPNNLFPYPTSGTGNTPFSFETWFATRGSGVILGQQDTSPFNTPNGYIPAVYVGTDGKLYVAMFWDRFVQISTATVNDGGFHHVAVTFDGTTENFFLDGTLIGSQPFTQNAYANTYFYQLGTGYAAGWPGANANWFSFNGIIDEASVYNRALTAAEVAAIFTAGSNGKCPP
jgi:hypothetical protein